MFYHGGNLSAARRFFPDAPEPWLDLSTGINSVSYPINAIDAATWRRLPEADDIRGLESIAAAAYGAADAASVVAAPGTQALIQGLPNLIPARKVGILGFTYAEHARAWSRAGAEVSQLADLVTADRFDVVVVVNPNNPDGCLIPMSELHALAGRLAAHGGTLIVDEAFMDVLPPSMSLVPALPAEGAVVLRSFGKTYGLAGLRLGFAVADNRLASRIRDALGPWAVSGPSIAIGRQALSDHTWLLETTGRLERDAARLDALLRSAGLDPIGGTPLFRLVHHIEARAWFVRLGRRGILVRAFTEKPIWLRFGLPGTKEAWALLEARLEGLSSSADRYTNP